MTFGTGGGTVDDLHAEQPDAGVMPAPMIEAIPGEGDAPELSISTLMSEEDFFGMFCAAFPLLAMGVAAARLHEPPPLASLASAGELPTARPASDALYALAKRTPWLQWLIDSKSSTVKELAIIAAFGSQLGMAAMQELRARMDAQQQEEGLGR